MQTFLNALGSAIEDQDGDSAAHLLRFDPPFTSGPVAGLASAIADKSFPSVISAALSGLPLAPFALHYLRSTAHTAAAAASGSPNDYAAAFASAQQALTPLAELARSSTTATSTRSVWFLPLLDVALTRLRITAVAADRHRAPNPDGDSGSSGGAGVHEGAGALAVDAMRKWLLMANLDRSELQDGLKRATLPISAHMLRLYFNLGLSQRATELLSMGGVLSMSMAGVARARAVSFQYFIGLTLVYNGDYDEARERLDWALRHCHRAHAANQRRILALLVPLRLAALLPVSSAALRQKGMERYAELAEAVAAGNVGAFNECLRKHRVYFIRQSVFMIVDGLRPLVYRHLLRRVYFKYLKPAERKIIREDLLLAALRTVGAPTDVDLLECVLVQLINAKRLKGYISRSAAGVLTLVLGPAPFPE